MNNNQTLLKNPELDFQITKFITSEVKYKFANRMDSFLQFWEHIRKNLKLVFHLDQIRYFLTFQMSFYSTSKFQSLSGKHIK